MDFDSNVHTVTYESGLYLRQDFPHTSEPVCILGRFYSTLHDMDELKADITSRIWCTYRKGFQPIGGGGGGSWGHTGDTGWGCMLRCGQMMLGQALSVKHLGRDWRWSPGCRDPSYWKLLYMFQDKKASTYSIHQIASMGESEGKGVGQWFGPNTIAQVLKRMVRYDDWSNMVIHVSMDNSVIQEEIREGCHKASGDRMAAASLTQGFSTGNGERGFSRSVSREACDVAWRREATDVASSNRQWSSLLLIIPLRLGLTDVNPTYFVPLKKCLELHQSVGIIGGKPNHAHWFIGYVGKELVYLDPHTTQPTFNLNSVEERGIGDASYHCQFASRMDITKLDPSIALGFFCDSEGDFDDLCTSLRSLCPDSKGVMFEVCTHRPPYLQYNPDFFASSPPGHAGASAMTPNLSGSDDEFEII